MGLFNNEKKVINDSGLNPNNLFGSIELSRVEIPVLKETYNYKFVNYGEDNLYPQYLANLSKTSALHRTLIENKSKLVCGSELYVNDIPLDDWIKTLTGVTAIRVNNLFYNTKYSLKDWIKRVSYDYQLFGAFTTEVIWDNEFEFIKAMKHIDCSKIRCAPINKNGEIDKYYYSREWSAWNMKVSDTIPIARFDMEDNQNMNQLIYKRDYYPNLTYYTEPSYIGGLTYINLDSELGLFNLSHIQNGMNPGLIFKIPYTFKSVEEKALFIGEFMKHFRGARNNNNPLILSKNGEAEWNIEKVDLQNFDQQLIALGDFILQQLIFAHKVTNGALVGIQTSGKLGGTNAEELKFSSDQFNLFVIEPARLMIEEVLEDVLKTHNLIVKVKIK